MIQTLICWRRLFEDLKLAAAGRMSWRIEGIIILVTNIVIPDYAAVMIDAFEKLNSEDASETDIYIQNVCNAVCVPQYPQASVGS